MCGIAGILTHGAPVSLTGLRAMSDCMVERGPDSSGEWISGDGQVGFGHRRLAILDLTEAGHQPMHSTCGRYTITYNGEIYNFAELRMALRAEGFSSALRGHSDTEVLLAAISAWGLRRALERASGMFALALWDQERHTLSLARDRFGEKPLYYGWTGAGFVFASTLAPIRASPGFANEVNPSALACLLARAYVPAPLSIYNGIYKLPPGSILTLPATAARTPMSTPPDQDHVGSIRVERYFDYGRQVLDGAEGPITDHEQAISALDQVLGNAIGRQLVADVPVGTFLSGGIDSSLVTAIAQRAVPRPINSFTLGFTEAGFDEAGHARRVAAAIGTDHTELYVTARDALEVIPMLPRIYDEPFADSSQIPTYLVSQLARRKVTVTLSGDGGDELFGGYSRHAQYPYLWNLIRRAPRPARRTLLGAASTLSPAVWDGIFGIAGRRRSPAFGQNVQRAVRVMKASDDFDDLFDGLLNDWAGRLDPMTGGEECGEPLRVDSRLADLPLAVQMMHADAVTYLPDDILAKVDRAGMAVSLESRVPFLDPEVTALAARLSPDLKFGATGGKQVLKDLLATFIPREMFERPKSGFRVPVGDWLRGPLREWAEELLSPDALAADGLLDHTVIRSRWQRHVDGHEDATQPLWSVLMYQGWRTMGPPSTESSPNRCS